MSAPPDSRLAPRSFELGHPLRSTLITSASSLLPDDPPPPGTSVLSPFVCRTYRVSLGIAWRVLKFRTRARIRVTPPEYRTPHGQKGGPRHAIPGKATRPQFRCRLVISIRRQ